MKIVSVVGTRPNIVKEYALQRQLVTRGIEEVVVHTGQHYDYEMSELFFQELKLDRPDYVNTLVKGTHAQETGMIMTFIEDVLVAETPDATLIYGDVNSTLAAAIASAKLGIPVVHVEAGIRSPARNNPEEINRRVADVLSDILFPVTQDAFDNLVDEGHDQASIYLAGDIVLDALQQAMAENDISCERGDYHVATIHRAENTDDPKRLRNIVTALCQIPGRVQFPVHPRTAKSLKSSGLWSVLQDSGNVEILQPLGFLSFLRLLAGCDKVITDSGGVRREAYMLGKPAITLIDLIWFPELVTSGWNLVADADSSEAIVMAVKSLEPPKERPPLFGDGRAAHRIADVLIERLG